MKIRPGVFQQMTVDLVISAASQKYQQNYHQRHIGDEQFGPQAELLNRCSRRFISMAHPFVEAGFQVPPHPAFGWR